MYYNTNVDSILAMLFLVTIMYSTTFKIRFKSARGFDMKIKIEGDKMVESMMILSLINGGALGVCLR